jgi:hypothetical protein
VVTKPDRLADTAQLLTIEADLSRQGIGPIATAATLFERDTVPGKIGRQMQTWVRMPEGWRVVAAHVSLDRRRVEQMRY